MITYILCIPKPLTQSLHLQKIDFLTKWREQKCFSNKNPQIITGPGFYLC